MSRKIIRNSKKYLISLILLSFLLITALIPFLSQKTYAAFSSVSVTISDSRASATAVNYNFAMTAAVSTAIKQVNVKFCNEAGLWGDTCTTPTGFSAASATRASDNISGTGAHADTPATGTFQTVIATPATQSPLAITYNLSNITNPSTINTTYYARVISYSDTGTTVIDFSQTAFAILTTTSVAVTAQVDPNLAFSVASVAIGQTVQGATTTVLTTANTIPLGNLSNQSVAIGAHDITVTTNAGSGFQVTVNQLGSYPLASGSAHFSPFSGTYATPTAWSAPAGSTANTNTAFFGYTTSDTNVDSNAFTSNKWAGTETTPRAVMSQTSGASAYVKRVGWQAQVNAIQPPGLYAGTMILVATPTY